MKKKQLQVNIFMLQNTAKSILVSFSIAINYLIETLVSTELSFPRLTEP